MSAESISNSTSPHRENFGMKNLTPIPLKPSLSWYQRGLSTNSARTPIEKRTIPQKIGATTIGQTMGFAVALAGLGDLVYKIFYSDSDSIWNKYVTPLLITSFGITGAGASAPPRNVLGIDILANGANNVISHFKSLEDNSICRFTKGVVKNIVDSLTEITGDLQNFIKKASYMATANVNDFSHDIKDLFDPSEIEYGDFYKNLNNALDTIGFKVEHEFDRGRIQLFVKSQNIFSSNHDNDVHYEPFLLFSMEPIAFGFLMNAVQEIFITSNGSTDKEIVQELISLITRSELPFIQGYTVMNNNGKGTHRYLKENIRPYISRENWSIIDTFFNTVAIKNTVRNNEATTDDDGIPMTIPISGLPKNRANEE